MILKDRQVKDDIMLKAMDKHYKLLKVFYDQAYADIDLFDKVCATRDIAESAQNARDTAVEAKGSAHASKHVGIVVRVAIHLCTYQHSSAPISTQYSSAYVYSPLVAGP